MKALFPILLTFTATFLFAQNNIPVFDRVVSPEEWENAQDFTIDYEINLGDNSPTPHKTTAYILYTSTNLYVGFFYPSRHE